MAAWLVFGLVALTAALTAVKMVASKGHEMVVH